MRAAAGDRSGLIASRYIYMVMAASLPPPPKGQSYLTEADVKEIERQYPNLECWQRDAFEKAPHRRPGRMEYSPMQRGKVRLKGRKRGGATTPQWQPYAYNKLTDEMVPIVKEAPLLKKTDAKTLLKTSVEERWAGLCHAFLTRNDPSIELQLRFMPDQLASQGYKFEDPYMRTVMEQGAAISKPILRFTVNEINGLKKIESALRVERKAVARVARDLRKEKLMEEAAAKERVFGDDELDRQTDKLYPWLDAAPTDSAK